MVSVFLGGDTMTGRGVDQLLPHPNEPQLHEGWVKDARLYVELAEQVNGPLPRVVGFDYIWGDALEELAAHAPDVRVINLETSVTWSDDFWPGKPIHYRMSPKNVPCLTRADIDVCALANNHVLDFGERGLLETLGTLQAADVKTAGAGPTLQEAQEPAIVDAADGRLLVFSFGSQTSGIPPAWAADGGPGVDLLPDESVAAAASFGERLSRWRQPGDVVIASVHWGSNWGFEVDEARVRFAHDLVDAGVDVVHGHSSHHVRPVEVYRDKLILYGAGQLIDDYEGISGYEEFRADLAPLYFVTLEAETGALLELRMTPMQVRRFQLNRASSDDALFLVRTLNEISGRFGTRVERADDGDLVVRGSR